MKTVVFRGSARALKVEVLDRVWPKCIWGVLLSSRENSLRSLVIVYERFSSYVSCRLLRSLLEMKGLDSGLELTTGSAGFCFKVGCYY